MIQPQELRIGNSVRFYPRNDLIYTVKCLNETFAELEHIDKDGTIYNSSVDYENLIPIPLTEEILIKAGFEKDLHCGYESVYHHKNFDLCIYNKIGTAGFELHEVDGFTINHEPFFNLHQFQNIFFSHCGEELKIQDNGKGYKKVTLTNNGKPCQYYIHRLVAEYIFSERDVIKNFLTEIKDDIESIDCGCSDCIGSFISGVNTVIKKYGLELKLNGESSVCSLGLDLIDKTENL